MLAAGADLFDHLLGLGFAELGIHQNRVFLAADQHRGHREDRLVAGVVNVQGQGRRCRSVGGESEGGGGQQNALERGETDHLLLRYWMASQRLQGTELSCMTQYKKCDAGT
ncbi:hypothetical protein D3C87_1905120 [compost metagenome]